MRVEAEDKDHGGGRGDANDEDDGEDELAILCLWMDSLIAR
jgi:hypothetical protein